MVWVTVGLTYVSGTRCGTTMMSVSERYCASANRARSGAAARPTANGSRISQRRATMLWTMSPGVYVRM